MGDVEIARRLQHVERAGDVGFDIGVRRVIGIRNRDQRRQMQHRVAALHRRAHAVRVADVAREDVELVAYLGGRGIQPAMRAQAVVMHEGAHAEIAANQFFREMRSDEAGSAGDQHFSQDVFP